ncbi:MAG: sugar nucleotide-binding protein [Rhodospirillaceae bacterium]|nr:sugar nucleotide-binding protein [Rhodospirillaceae bacterium]
MFLIVGGDSEIGRATVRHAAERGIPVVSTTRRPGTSGRERLLLDLDRIDDDWRPPDGVTAVCICAAFTGLAACANAPERAAHVNVDQTLRLVRRLAECGIYTLFLSTNQVFDGTISHVRPDTPLSPVSVYGRQKAQTERALHSLMREGASIGILRLAKVVPPAMPLLVRWREALLAGRPVQAFGDMSMAPVPRAQAAEAVLRLLADRAAVIAQLSGPRDIFYGDVARLIAAEADADPALVIAVAAGANGQPEGATPRHTTLDSAWLRETHGIDVGPPDEVVRAAIAHR